MKAPVIIDPADIFVDGLKKSFGRAFVGKKIERGHVKFAHGKIAGSGNRLRYELRKNQHAPRHMERGSHEQITLPALAGEDFLGFYGTFKSVAGVFLADDVVLRHTPPDKEFWLYSILVF